MAYKTFVNGFPLNASEINNNLMNQSIATFLDASARSTAISAPVQGQVTYLTSDSTYYSYDGAAWVELIPEVSTSPNYIINGAFDIWQRGTSFSNPGIFVYTADRWQAIVNGSPTHTVSKQTFTPGAAPVAGYEAESFLRLNVTGVSGSTVIAMGTRLEDVRTLAGQTATFSFWAKADTARTWSASVLQNFGSGGSAELATVASPSLSVTTSWQRFTMTVAIPGISGKTIGTGSYLHLVIYGTSDIVQTLDIWGVQLEAGSVATPFKRNAPSLQGELAACQRYYAKSYLQAAPAGTISTASNIVWNAVTTSANRNYVSVKFPTSMRAAPTVSLYSPITGTLGKAYNALTSAADKNVSTNYIGEDTFAAYIGPTDGANAVGDLLLVHYVASAEL